MHPIRLADETRYIGPPEGWTENECSFLSIYDHEVDGHNVMVSAWMPSQEDIIKINAGEPIYLHIYGTRHPVVGFSV